MQLLITGANGFVGNILQTKLLQYNHNFTRLVRDVYLPDLQYITFNCLIHLAGRAHVMHDTAQDVYQAYKEVNVDYTLKVAKHAHELGVKRFVFLSSIKVNGEHTSTPFNEENLPNPQDAYGKTKFEAEEALKAFCLANEMEYVIIRPPLIYGPGVKGNFKTLIRLCQRPIPLPFGRVENLRSFVNLDNLCSFILLCCQHPNAANQTFLISDDEDVSTTALITSIKQALGKQPWLLPIPSQSLDALFRVLGKKNYSERLLGNLQVDITKAKTVLGWQPVTRFQAGIQSMVDAEC